MLQPTSTADIAAQMQEIGHQAKCAAALLAQASTKQKNVALKAMADAILADQDAILSANMQDVDNAKAKGLTPALLDRLTLTPSRIQAMADGLSSIAELPDPIGTILAEWDRPSGLHIQRVRVPLGVIGIIYESRPNVTADAGALCLKSGNAAILRGGSESDHSTQAIAACLHRGLAASDLPEHCIQIAPTTDRAFVGAMLRAHDTIDVIVPRGGPSLISRVMEESRIPVFAHLSGLCHTFLDKDADPDKALALTVNAKMRRTGICGATETLLVHRDVAATLLPPIAEALRTKGCVLRGDSESCSIDPTIIAADEADWDTEYLDAILSIKIVDGIDEAITHINGHGSHHTDCIVTENETTADRFLACIDSGIVMVNTSTQFADGGEFGMGAEIGISTGKMHARGPVGTEQLTSYKYLVRSAGVTRP